MERSDIYHDHRIGMIDMETEFEKYRREQRERGMATVTMTKHPHVVIIESTKQQELYRRGVLRENAINIVFCEDTVNCGAQVEQSEASTSHKTVEYVIAAWNRRVK